MKINKLVLTVILLAMFSSLAVAKELPEQILKSLPYVVETFIADQPHLYDDPRLGASIGYNDFTGVALTLYLYDQGLGDIASGVTSKIILDDKQEVIRAIKESGNWSNVLLVKDVVQALKLANGGEASVFFTQFSLEGFNPKTESSIVLRSDLYLLGVRSYICKIRITRPEFTSANKEQEIKKVVIGLLSKLVN